jgi:gliding motility-associated-like protein
VQFFNNHTAINPNLSSNSLCKKVFLVTVLYLISFVASAQLKAKFGATPTSGCAPISVNFHDSSTGNPISWKWEMASVVGGVTGTYSQFSLTSNPNPGTIFQNPGTFTIRLIVTNASGVKDTLVKPSFINVYASPTVSISPSSPVSGCFPFPICFTDNSIAGSGTIVKRLWDFGDGVTDTAKNPCHTYLGPGSFGITLTVTNSNNCATTRSFPSHVNISDGVHAAFTNISPTGCTVPQTIPFQNQSTGTGLLTYQWIFGDAGLTIGSTATSPSHSYAVAGSYTVQLVVTNSTGCRDTAKHIDSIVIGVVHANFTMPATVCVGATFSLTNTSLPTPVSGIWRFDDGTTTNTINGAGTTKSFNTAGLHTVKLVSNFGGCLDSIEHQINVLPKPTIDFAGDILVACKPPLTVNFSNITTGAISYEWHFGDGGVSNQQTPQYTYNTAGFFTDTLIATNANGCKDTVKKVDYIKIKGPTITINNLPQQGCAPFTWTFGSTPNSIVPIIKYEWFSNNVLFSTLQTPTNTFPLGEYDIKLVITTVGGCTDTVIVPKGIKASLKPVPLFTATPRVVCAFKDVCFTDLSTGTIDFYDWDFGDGVHNSSQNPCHAYEDTGYFTVTLIVGNNGCRDTLKLIDYIYVTPPIARFTIVKNCSQHYTIAFNNTSIGADTWTWDFGDSPTPGSNIYSPTHTYAAVGTYVVTLTVHNNVTGCDHLKTETIKIADENAIFTASALELCKNTATVFTAGSTHSAADILSYDWDFGDGTIPHGTGASVSHIYTVADTFTVTLIITDINGCKDTLVKNNYIRVNGPTANFIPSTPGSCLNAAINFTDQSVGDGSHPITQWIWDYGDNVIETLTSPPFSHTYNSTGIFGVTLIIKDSFGCTDTKVKPNILTISKPKADFFTLDTISCPNKPILFGNSSAGPGLVYDWDFGDITPIVHGATPTHFYVNQGIYTVHLTVTDIYGCVHDTTKVAYVIIKDPVANFTVVDSVKTCPPLNGVFTNNSLYYQSYSWDFDDGSPLVTNILNPTHVYNSAGTFYATLTVKSAGGCISIKKQKMVISGPRGTFTYSPIIGCKPLKVNFVTHTNTTDLTGDSGEGQLVTTTDSLYSITYDTIGEFTPKIILKDNGGCTVAITGTVPIKVKGVYSKFKMDTTLRCNSGNVIFTNQSNANELVTGYEWNFGDNSPVSNDFAPTHPYSSGPGLYYPTLIAHTVSGCTDTTKSPVPIKVVKTPEITITQPLDKCVPATLSFQGNLINADTSVITWKWKFSDGDLRTTQNVTKTFNTADSYADTLYAVNSSGCRDTAISFHEVYPKPVIDAGADIVICQGTGQILTANGGQGYSWSPLTGLSNIIANSATAMPDSVTNYTVTGTSSFGCVNTDIVKVDVRHPFSMPPGNNATVCEGSATTFTATGAVQYSWSPSTGLNTTIGPIVIAKPITTTDYEVVGKDDKNCFSATARFKVKVYPVPTVNAGADKTINVGQSITLTPTTTGGVTNVVWTPNTWITSINSPSITVKPNLDQKYKVTVTNAGGCIASATVNVFVLCDGANVFIPNTFSPNADGANDIFFPRGTGLYTIKQLRVFNRWGEEVFTRSNFNANDEKAGWDGTFKGQKLTPDVYVYIMDIQCQNNSVLVYKGNIALIK